MRYDKIPEVDAVLRFQKKKYKVKIKELYDFGKAIDCIVYFSSYTVQQHFYEEYMCVNGHNLSKSYEINKFCTINDEDFFGYFYQPHMRSTENLPRSYLKAHLKRIDYKQFKPNYRD